MADFKEMLLKAKSGALSAPELAAAVTAVSEGGTAHRDLYTALHVVGLAGSPRLAATVRPFLARPDDPMLSRLALQILGDFWGLTPELTPELRSFVRGVGWDTDGDVRDMAISLTGRLLREKAGPSDLAEALIEIAEGQEDTFVREAALRSLATALGDSLADPASSAVRVRAESPKARDVLDRARARYVPGS